jgi:predicted dehydrogenase
VAPVRVGIIGTGFGARVVAPSFEAAGCTIGGIASPRDDAAWRALCASGDVDLVAVHSPPFLHRAHVEAALAHGKHVLCDKPFGLDAGEAQAMLDAARAAGVVHALNFEFRRHPVVERMRSLVAEGAIGRPEHVQWVHVSSGTRIPLRRFGWLFDRSRGGGWIGAWCSHTIDALRNLLGEVAAVTACAGPVTIAERPDADGVLHACTAEDAMTASLVLEGGVTVAIDSSYAATVNLPARTVITGSEGALENVGNDRLTLFRPGAPPERIDVAGDDDGHADRHALPMRRWAADLAAAVRDGRPVAPSFDDGLACRRVLDALLEAAGAPAPATPARAAP